MNFFKGSLRFNKSFFKRAFERPVILFSEPFFFFFAGQGFPGLKTAVISVSRRARY